MLITPEQIKVELSGYEANDERLNRIARSVSNRFERAIRRELLQAERTEVITYFGGDLVELSVAPLVSVASLTSNDGYEDTPLEWSIYDSSSSLIEPVCADEFPVRYGSYGLDGTTRDDVRLTVVYTAGYLIEDVPEEIQDLLIRQGAREYLKKSELGSLKKKKIGPLEYEYHPSRDIRNKDGHYVSGWFDIVDYYSRFADTTVML